MVEDKTTNISISHIRINLLREFQAPPVAPPKVTGIEDVIDLLEKIGIPHDKKQIYRAYQFAKEKHKKQTRKDGTPYITHPLNVSYIVASMKLDTTSIVSALLHDVVEDTEATLDEIERLFGSEVALIVDGVSKIGRHSSKYTYKDAIQAENFRKLLLSTAKDIRVILIKLADRLHNMTTLGWLPREKQIRKARETLDIYAPIAHRLGISHLWGDLSDLSFYFLKPEKCFDLRVQLYFYLRERAELLDEILEALNKLLANYDVTINYRVKRLWSIYKKMEQKKISNINNLYDYVAFRVLTNTKEEAYAILGLVHGKWQHVPGTIKDYIGTPKENLYQSLHTTILYKGKPYEIQIRTYEMDKIAEEGIAAHWAYKEKGSKIKAIDKDVMKLRSRWNSWISSFLDLKDELTDPKEFFNLLKIDLYTDQVYVLSPKGEVFAFPVGATPIDFAYRIHTEVGNHCSGARVNNVLVPLNYKLKTGDTVEILTSQKASPKRHWLNLVVTSKAKSKIKQWLLREEKEKAKAIGKHLLEKELENYNLSLENIKSDERFPEYLKSKGLSTLEDLFVHIGFGKISTQSIIKHFHKEEKKLSKILQKAWGIVEKSFKKSNQIILVDEETNFLTYFAKCCAPIPGDKIIGYITRGRGISIHRIECKNIRNNLFPSEKFIKVYWNQEYNKKSLFPVKLHLELIDKRGIIASVTSILDKHHINIGKLNADAMRKNVPPGRGYAEIVIFVKNTQQLTDVIKNIKKVKGVIKVKRLSGS